MLTLGDSHAPYAHKTTLWDFAINKSNMVTEWVEQQIVFLSVFPHFPSVERPARLRLW